VLAVLAYSHLIAIDSGLAKLIRCAGPAREPAIHANSSEANLGADRFQNAIAHLVLVHDFAAGTAIATALTFDSAAFPLGLTIAESFGYEAKPKAHLRHRPASRELPT
jgi:hypothetical protein